MRGSNGRGPRSGLPRAWHRPPVRGSRTLCCDNGRRSSFMTSGGHPTGRQAGDRGPLSEFRRFLRPTRYRVTALTASRWVSCCGLGPGAALWNRAGARVTPGRHSRARMNDLSLKPQHVSRGFSTRSSREVAHGQVGGHVARFASTRPHGCRSLIVALVTIMLAWSSGVGFAQTVNLSLIHI